MIVSDGIRVSKVLLFSRVNKFQLKMHFDGSDQQTGQERWAYNIRAVFISVLFSDNKSPNSN